ncbi:PAC2 family-domain-containing protein [Naematelia encephala]|uniref:Proteasome assembly chaperone 2 n=1 Tax=Naematelia encephala TaxID=71784 RepID=A0A1Y2AMC0_9TREE|nr:PAC2 family-domain-containing protein [Naematelia encephala]
MVAYYPSGPSTLRNKVLIVPAVSLANLPQLAADLLITTLGLSRTGFIGRGETVIPLSGVGERGEILTGGLEVYGREDSELVVIQQRSPTLKAKKDAHLSLLSDFITSNDFAFVLILASLDASDRDDESLQHAYVTAQSPEISPELYYSTYHRYIIPPNLSSSDKASLTKRLPNLASRMTTPTAHQPYPPFLPYAGLTRRILTTLQKDTDKVPHAALAYWCSEGDNRADAHALAAEVLEVFTSAGDLKLELKEPKSWEGLFGPGEGWTGATARDAVLYG